VYVHQMLDADAVVWSPTWPRLPSTLRQTRSNLKRPGATFFGRRALRFSTGVHNAEPLQRDGSPLRASLTCKESIEEESESMMLLSLGFYEH
jgi:hypothetical protein